MLEMKWVDSESEISPSLWDKCFLSPIEGRWWYSVLENSGLEDQFKFAYGLLSKDKEPIGIVPIFFNDVPIELVAPEGIAKVFRLLSKIIPGADYQRTLFVGSPCTDEGTVGLIPGTTLSEVAEFIHDELIKKAATRKAPMIVWKDFPQTEQLDLDKLCKNGKAFKMVSYPGTVIYLQEPSMQSYIKGLKSSHRHNLLKKLKRSKEKFAFDVSIIQNPDEATIDEIFALFWQTYEHGKTKFERLNKEFFALISGQRASWYILLREQNGGKLVAFMLCFLLGKRVINKFIGLDYSIPREANLYFRLQEAALAWTISQELKEFQSGQTGYRFKIETGHSLVPLFNYCQNRNPLVNMIYAFLSRSVSWATLDSDLETFLKTHPIEN